MKKPLSVSVVFTADFISDMSKQHEHPANDSSHQMSLKWEESNTNIGGMPALSKKACKALKGFNHGINSVQREINYLGVSENENNEFKSRIKAEANILPYPSRCFWERSCCLCSWRVRRGERAAWCLGSSNTEAPTWGRKQRAPRGGPRGDVLHDSLTVLSPPPAHPCVGPPSLQQRRGVSCSDSPPAHWCNHQMRGKV